MYLNELFEKYAEWKILKFFLENPQVEIHLKALSRELNVSPGTLSVMLKKAHSAKLLNKKSIANIHLYSLNKNEQTKRLRRLVDLL